jgi:thymidylate synthase ThyX
MIYVKDGRDIGDPQVMAMIQAFYSRSPTSIEQKLAELGGKEELIRDRIKTYYVGYGDDSIGDCGYFTVFIEGVSILMAKVIQQSQLYDGQEASTRYIDFQKMGYVDPLGRPDILELVLNFYIETLAKLKPFIRATYPWEGDAEDKKAITIWERACDAKAFDIARGFLTPAMKTVLSWTTSFRNARDHLNETVVYPTKEAKDVSEALYKALAEKYSSSFQAFKNWKSPLDESYWDTPINGLMFEPSFSVTEKGRYTNNLILQYASKPRQRLIPLPLIVNHNIRVRMNWELDYGSVRDLLRHRNMLQYLPTLEKQADWHSWYTNWLELANIDWKAFRVKWQDKIKTLHGSVFEQQYYVPMCGMVPVNMDMHLGQAVFLLERRSSRMVHPTLRNESLKAAKQLQACYPDLYLNIDTAEGEFFVNRGKQTIVKAE